jgi:hypothetical protein
LAIKLVNQLTWSSMLLLYALNNLYFHWYHIFAIIMSFGKRCKTCFILTNLNLLTVFYWYHIRSYPLVYCCNVRPFTMRVLNGCWELKNSCRGVLNEVLNWGGGERSWKNSTLLKLDGRDACCVLIRCIWRVRYTARQGASQAWGRGKSRLRQTHGRTRLTSGIFISFYL